MPLKRRLIKVGNSRAVVIPPDWLKYYEEKTGQPIKNILMELDNVITISIAKENEKGMELPFAEDIVHYSTCELRDAVATLSDASEGIITFDTAFKKACKIGKLAILKELDVRKDIQKTAEALKELGALIKKLRGGETRKEVES